MTDRTADLSRERPGASADAWIAWRPAGLAQDVILPACDRFGQALAAVVPDWPGVRRPVPTGTGDGPLGRSGVFVEPEVPGRYFVASPYLDQPMRGLTRAGAVCALVADLSQACVDAGAGRVGLHCGAFRAGDGLVAVTGAHRAGKSTLVARLTAEPAFEVFCDDVLPLSEAGDGIALGIAPRLRLPLPAAASGAFRGHVAAHLGPRDSRYGYLCPPTLAPHGARAPLRTVILLDRRDDPTPSALHALDPGEAFHHLLARNLGLFDTADGAVAALERLLSRLVCLRLVYSDLEDAVGLLRRLFAKGPLPDPALPVAPPLDTGGLASAAEPEAACAPVDPDLRWMRAEGVAVRRIGRDAVLWRPGGASVWQLNVVAHAVWELLGEGPASAEDMAAVLAGIFVEQDPARLCADLAGLLAGLYHAALIRPAP